MRKAAIADRLELVSQALVGSTYSLVTRSPLATILKSGYWAKWNETGLRRGDRINVVADYDGEIAFAMLGVIDATHKGTITVRQI
jgi:hypothetical protein